MTATESLTDLNATIIPARENRMSRRYLRILEKWIPVGVEYFSDWPVRPGCGHFFGGCHWYGNETVGPAEAFAAASTSPEYDQRNTGVSREELRSMALKGLRYLCFTHDTGPEDCVRPSSGMGRQENCGTKWGEKGRGFFPESQCGQGIAGLARICVLLRDWIDHETLSMVARIHEDYATRFGEMAPRSGVYADTQMEENAWTSTGLVSCHLFLSEHPKAQAWEEMARRWMFSTCAAPQDAKNEGAISDTSVSGLTQRTFTTLPDYWAENHGIVHPNYTGSGIWSIMSVGIQLGLWGREIPPELLWNRRRIYDNLKRLVDDSGYPAAVQGMDWHYLYAAGTEAPHAVASVIFRDPDAAALQLRGLRNTELRQRGNAGRLYDRSFAMKAHDQQDPMIMREVIIRGPAWLYLFHRIYGPGPKPTPGEELERRLRGVKIYPHAGFVHHRHRRGQNSFSWRNSVMVLPLTREGIYTISPCSDSWLGHPVVRNHADSHNLVSVKVEEYDEGFAAAMVMDRCQESLRQQVLLASLPDGRLLSHERFIALKDITLCSLDQGFLRITNECFPSLGPNCRGRRILYSQEGGVEHEGWLGESEEDDMVSEVDGAGWLNVDDRVGICYLGEGRSVYHNRHYFKPYRAIADDLVLSHQDEVRRIKSGCQAGRLAAMLIPEQIHTETPASSFHLLSGDGDSVGMLADGFLAVANFTSTAGTSSFTMPRPKTLQVFPGSSMVVGKKSLSYGVNLQYRRAALLQGSVVLTVEGEIRVDAHGTGQTYITNLGQAAAKVSRPSRTGRPRTMVIEQDETSRI